MGRTLIAERRHYKRTLAADAGLSARLRPGGEVCLVDVCAGGALVQTSRQLRPGSAVQVLLTSTHHRTWIAAQVIRCEVASIDPVLGALYWGALRFEDRADWLDPRRDSHPCSGFGGAVI